VDKKFEEKDSVSYAVRSGTPKSTALEENVQNPAQVCVQSPTKSSRNAAQELGLSD
jgi:hypothetical protein